MIVHVYCNKGQLDYSLEHVHSSNEYIHVCLLATQRVQWNLSIGDTIGTGQTVH